MSDDVTLPEAVAQVTAATETAVIEATEGALEVAAEKIEAVQEVAEIISDAAMMTTLGQRIADVEGKYTECLSRLENADDRANQLSTRLEEQALELAALTLKIVATIPPQPLVLTPSPDQPSSSTLPISEALEPGVMETPEAPVIEPAAKRRRLRFI